MEFPEDLRSELQTIEDRNYISKIKTYLNESTENDQSVSNMYQLANQGVDYYSEKLSKNIPNLLSHLSKSPEDKISSYKKIRISGS